MLCCCFWHLQSPQSTLIADGHLSATELAALASMRSSAQVTDSEHRAICQALGVAGDEAWKKLVAEGQMRREKLEVSNDCAHCHNTKHQLPTDHLVMDCMHLW